MEGTNAYPNEADPAGSGATSGTSNSIDEPTTENIASGGTPGDTK